MTIIGQHEQGVDDSLKWLNLLAHKHLIAHSEARMLNPSLWSNFFHEFHLIDDTLIDLLCDCHDAITCVSDLEISDLSRPRAYRYARGLAWDFNCVKLELPLII